MTNWVLATSKNTILLTSDNLRVLKFVQLLTSKYLTLFVAKTNFAPNVKPSDLAEKVKFVYDIIFAELGNIEKLCAQRERDNFHIELIKTTKEFLDIVDATDDIIEKSYEAEIDNLLNYKNYCTQHKKFLFRILFDADYSTSTKELKDQLFVQLENYKHDSRYVSVDLNGLLFNKFK